MKAPFYRVITMQDTGNAQDADMYLKLIAMLFSGSLTRRGRAAQLLTEIGVPGIAKLLESSGEADRMMRMRALMALGALFRPEANLYDSGKTRDNGSKSSPATTFFSNGQKSRVVGLLIEKMQHDDDEECRIMAAASLMKIGDRSGLEEVRKACLQFGKEFEGQILDVVWGTSEIPGNDMPDTLQPQRRDTVFLR
jgi:hypothetical protein